MIISEYHSDLYLHDLCVAVTLDHLPQLKYQCGSVITGVTWLINKVLNVSLSSIDVVVY